MNWRQLIGLDELKREPPPRGAIVIVVIGLLACVVAAVATTDEASGEAHLEWVQQTKIADSAPARVPGSDQEMQLVKGEMRATGTNVSGYSLYLVTQTLKIGAEAPLKKSHIVCAMSVPNGVEIGHSAGGLRTLYPRSAEGIYTQEVPEALKVDFSSHASEYAAVEVGDVVPRFTNEKGVKVEWPEFEPRTEHIEYFIAGKPKQDLELPFYAIWRSTAVPKATTACTLETGAGKATVKAKGELRHLPPPIDEEAEEEAQERREEEETTAEEEADEAGGEGE